MSASPDDDTNEGMNADEARAGDWRVGDWAWSLRHGAACRVVEIHCLWGHSTLEVWLPELDQVLRLPEEEVQPLPGRGELSTASITYRCAAARISDALQRDTLVAPLEGTVIPLPHQIYALSRAMSGDTVRYLLADEVGLGKTIEAGLILRELKIRGLIKRILVVAPTGLVSQWVSEMQVHFNETFRLVIPGEFKAWRKIAAVDNDENLWRLHDQVVCPLDSVKPMDSRKGWSAAKVARYNQERFEDLVTAGWDLIIIDESHRLGGSTDQVARYRLGAALAQAAPYLLLLSATPHQGKTDAFRRLLSFLDEDAFPEDDSISQASVAPYVIRTEKRNAIDAQVLISTDAGGEGLNLQFCHVIFNYDLPWNPMKIEQRIGRVDRIGQTHVVRAQNFTLEDTVEQRVREVLEEKLERILLEFGVDKLADVLDSEEGGVDFDSLYVSAVLNPAAAEQRARQLAEQVRERAAAVHAGARLLGKTDPLDASAARGVAEHQVPYWTERMTVSYLRSHPAPLGDRSKRRNFCTTQQRRHRREGGARRRRESPACWAWARASRPQNRNRSWTKCYANLFAFGSVPPLVSASADHAGYELTWPDGDRQQGIVFSRQDADQAGTRLLSLDHPRIRDLLVHLPPFVPGQALPVIHLAGISDKIGGIWSLWKIELQTEEISISRILPLFVSDDGRVLAPTARAVWDRLISMEADQLPRARSAVDNQSAQRLYTQSRREAEHYGRSLFSELRDSYRRRQAKMLQKMQRAFDARRKAIDRIGLPGVREHRERELTKEEHVWRRQFGGNDTAFPQLTALLLVRVASSQELS